jgi:hypothetical protein
MSGNYVINIGRQLGSGGKEIGEKLAVRLGINFYDKELINLASEESGLCKEFLKRLMKKPRRVLLADCSVCVSLLSVRELCHVTTA